MLSDTNKARVSVLVHALVGVGVGYASLFVGRALFAFILMIIAMLVMGRIAERTFAKGKGRSWWLANGALVLGFLWFLSWVLFLNVGV
ncbi:MAG: hypothetical protein KKA90_02275 [Nanoarchaeota archaeon]|nr:hypothetical protein [Nanoarchaeota archaeon]